MNRRMTRRPDTLDDEGQLTEFVDLVALALSGDLSKVNVIVAVNTHLVKASMLPGPTKGMTMVEWHHLIWFLATQVPVISREFDARYGSRSEVMLRRYLERQIFAGWASVDWKGLVAAYDAYNFRLGSQAAIRARDKNFEANLKKALHAFSQNGNLTQAEAALAVSLQWFIEALSEMSKLWKLVRPGVVPPIAGGQLSYIRATAEYGTVPLTFGDVLLECLGVELSDTQMEAFYQVLATLDAGPVQTSFRNQLRRALSTDETTAGLIFEALAYLEADGAFAVTARLSRDLFARVKKWQNRAGIATPQNWMPALMGFDPGKVALGLYKSQVSGLGGKIVGFKETKDRLGNRGAEFEFGPEVAVVPSILDLPLPEIGGFLDKSPQALWAMRKNVIDQWEAQLRPPNSLTPNGVEVQFKEGLLTPEELRVALDATSLRGVQALEAKAQLGGLSVGDATRAYNEGEISFGMAANFVRIAQGQKGVASSAALMGFLFAFWSDLMSLRLFSAALRLLAIVIVGGLLLGPLVAVWFYIAQGTWIAAGIFLAVWFFFSRPMAGKLVEFGGGVSSAVRPWSKSAKAVLPALIVIIFALLGGAQVYLNLVMAYPGPFRSNTTIGWVLLGVAGVGVALIAIRFTLLILNWIWKLVKRVVGSGVRFAKSRKAN